MLMGYFYDVLTLVVCPPRLKVGVDQCNGIVVLTIGVGFYALLVLD